MIELLEKTEQRNLQARLIARAWYDESFKERLLADPRSAIAEELDLKLPDHLQVTVLEETPDTLFLLLPGNGQPLFGDHHNGSAEPQTGSERELRAELIAKSRQDAAFKEKLLDNPRLTIELELGIKLPERCQVMALEQTPDQLVVLLPINRTALAEEQLNGFVGGSTGDCATNCCDSSSASASSSISACATYSNTFCSCSCQCFSSTGCISYSNSDSISNSNCCG